MKLFLAAFFACALASLGACSQETSAPTAIDNRMTEESTILIIRFNVAEDRLDDFLGVMTNINGLMAGEDGFINAVVYRNNDDPLAFTLVESWETRGHHEKHFQHIDASGDWADIVAMLKTYPAMSYNQTL